MNAKIMTLPVTTAGKLMFYCFPYRKSVILENIDQVYGDRLTSNEKQHLVMAFYSHLCRAIKETICLRFMSQADLRAAVEVRGHEYLLQVSAQGKGVLILTGHFGSWEVAPIGGILNFEQFKGRFHFIRRTLGSKKIERFLFRRYYEAGLNVIQKQNALQHVTEALSKNDAVVFVLDQHASLANRDGIAAEFFGKKAGTYRSLATCARYTGVPVVPVSAYRLENGKHVLEFKAPIVWEEHETTQASLYHNTCAYNRALEDIILAHPEQWMWLHRRWKLK
jgi:Kdo2-lipid IVA lauroyltransferase/acyltransferase